MKKDTRRLEITTKKEIDIVSYEFFLLLIFRIAGVSIYKSWHHCLYSKEIEREKARFNGQRMMQWAMHMLTTCYVYTCIVEDRV